MEELNVKNVIISRQTEKIENYEKFKQIINTKKINVIIVGATSSCSQKLQIEQNLYFDILWPNNEQQIKENPLNNNSIVCKLNYNDFSMLFTGDIEKIAEQHILEQYKNTNILNSTVLKIAHHGSKTSSTQEFLETIKPKIVLIGVGKDNLFGHPNEEVIKRLENMRKQYI